MTADAGKGQIDGAGGASPHPSADRLEELGIVGAGGGGFPASAKFKARVSLVIANAAECEPLLHKDKELLQNLSEPFLRGMKIAMELVGAREGVIGIKEKYHDIIEALERQTPDAIRVVPLPDCYPAGDEFILVHLSLIHIFTADVHMARRRLHSEYRRRPILLSTQVFESDLTDDLLHHRSVDGTNRVRSC